jgi:hypothetical protein
VGNLRSGEGGRVRCRDISGTSGGWKSRRRLVGASQGALGPGLAVVQDIGREFTPGWLE